MKLKLLHKDPDRGHDLWRCKDVETGEYHSVDFYVDNPKLRDKLSKGMVIEVDYLHPYVELSGGARLIPEPEEEQS